MWFSKIPTQIFMKSTQDQRWRAGAFAGFFKFDVFLNGVTNRRNVLFFRNLVFSVNYSMVLVRFIFTGTSQRLFEHAIILPVFRLLERRIEYQCIESCVLPLIGLLLRSCVLMQCVLNFSSLTVTWTSVGSCYFSRRIEFVVNVRNSWVGSFSNCLLCYVVLIYVEFLFKVAWEQVTIKLRFIAIHLLYEVFLRRRSPGWFCLFSLILS